MRPEHWAPQLIHAAGESSPGDLPDHTFAIALEARDEPHLLEIHERLTFRGIPHKLIREPDAPYLNGATAIGCDPRAWREARRVLSTLPKFKPRLLP